MTPCPASASPIGSGRPPEAGGGGPELREARGRNGEDELLLSLRRREEGEGRQARGGARFERQRVEELSGRRA